MHDLVTGGHPDAPQFRFVEEVGLAAVTLIAALIAAEHIRWVVAHLTPPVLGAALLAIAGGLSLLRSRAPCLRSGRVCRGNVGDFRSC